MREEEEESGGGEGKGRRTIERRMKRGRRERGREEGKTGAVPEQSDVPRCMVKSSTTMNI